MIERTKEMKGKLCATYARTRKGKELELNYTRTDQVLIRDGPTEGTGGIPP
jgi:hypothetical protein